MGSGTAAALSMPGSWRMANAESSAMKQRASEFMRPQAFEIDSMPWILDQYKGMYEDAQSEWLPTIRDQGRYEGLVNDQYSLSKMLTEKALSGSTEQTDLQYAQSRDDAINQAMAMAASRGGRTGLAQRQIGGLAAGYNQETARDMAGSRINEVMQNMGAANQAAGFLQRQEYDQFMQSRNAKQQSIYGALGGFEGALERDRQARIARENVRMGHSGIGVSPTPGVGVSGMLGAGKAADSGLGSMMSLMSLFGFGGAAAGAAGGAASSSSRYSGRSSGGGGTYT